MFVLHRVVLSLLTKETSITVLLVTKAIYNVYFHPIRAYKGPWLARASRLPYLYYQVTGRLPHQLKKWHEQFGDIIRIAPNDLSYIKSQAWFDIHGMASRLNPYFISNNTVTLLTETTKAIRLQPEQGGSKGIPVHTLHFPIENPQ